MSAKESFSGETLEQYQNNEVRVKLLYLTPVCAKKEGHYCLIYF